MVIRRFAVLAVLALAVSVPAQAATTAHTITVHDMMFDGGTLTAALGDTVTWSFQEGPHTTTSNQHFWNSGYRTAGQHYTLTFRFAGRYPYHCAIHPTTMTGTITVPLRVVKGSTGYWLRWSVATTTPTNRSFDVQVKKPGSTSWVFLRYNTTTASMHYTPSPSGSYALRARTDNKSAGTSSNWTPARTITIP
jgi:plastocyanin